MSVDYVQKVIELAREFDPVEQPIPRDWERVEGELGLQLPMDFKLLVTAFGSGEFGTGLTLSNPVSSSEYTRLSVQDLRHYRLAMHFLEDRMGIRFFPSDGGLLLIGGAERQQFFYRTSQGAKVLPQLINLDHEYEITRDLGMSLPHFLNDLYLGLLDDGWAKELSHSLWGNGSIPFFSPWPVKGPR